MDKWMEWPLVEAVCLYLIYLFINLSPLLTVNGSHKLNFVLDERSRFYLWRRNTYCGGRVKIRSLENVLQRFFKDHSVLRTGNLISHIFKQTVKLRTGRLEYAWGSQNVSEWNGLQEPFLIRSNSPEMGLDHMVSWADCDRSSSDTDLTHRMVMRVTPYLLIGPSILLRRRATEWVTVWSCGRMLTNKMVLWVWKIVKHCKRSYTICFAIANYIRN